MGMEVDGKAILILMANHPAIFAMQSNQINALSTNMLILRLKDKKLSLEHIKGIFGNIGSHDFLLTLDNMTDRDVSALSKRLDPKNAQCKSANAAWHREHIAKLANGDIDPATAQQKAPKSDPPPARTRSQKAKTGDVMQSLALKPRAPRKKATTR